MKHFPFASPMPSTRQLLLELWNSRNCSFQSKPKTNKRLLSDTEKALKVKLRSIMEELTQSHRSQDQTRRFDNGQYEFRRGKCAPTQLQQNQKNQLFDLQLFPDHYCSVWTMFGFNRAKIEVFCYIHFSTSKTSNLESSKKGNQLFLLNFGDFQFLVNLNNKSWFFLQSV